jgi:hypothetical protein
MGVKSDNVFALRIRGTAISALSLFGFILIAKTADPQLRYAFVLFYIFATFFLFVMASYKISKSRLITLASATALSSICVEQLTGFYFFPGVTKDIYAFGWDHFKRLTIILCLAPLWYLMIALIVRAVSLKSPAIR